MRYPSDQTIVAAAVLLMGFPVALRVNDALKQRDEPRRDEKPSGYYRVLEDERRWERDRDEFHREWERRR